MVYTNKGKEHHQYKHGMCGTRPYSILAGIKSRCYNKKEVGYKMYGKKGIKMCKRWKKFENFWEDMKDGYSDELSIDRINGSGNYCKENCRWATRTEQNRNKSNVKLYPFKGELLPIRVISVLLGLSGTALLKRIKSGLTFEEAIKKPKMEYKGVGYDKNRKKWRTYVKRDRKTFFIGRYNTKQEALVARKKWLVKYQNQSKTRHLKSLVQL